MPPSDRPGNATHPAAPHHAAACYEALRAQITGQLTGQLIGSTAPTPLRGVGLGLLLQQGVAAWWQAVRSTMSAPLSTTMSLSPSSSGSASAVITDDDQDAPHSRDDGPSGALLSASQHGDVVVLLARLVLSACPSRPTRHDPALYDGASP